MRHLGVFWNGGKTPGVPLDIPVESTPSCCAMGMPLSFPVESGKGSLIGSGRGGKGTPLELWWDPQCSSRVEMVMWGYFLSCSKAVKDALRFRREGHFSLGMPQQKTASSRLEGRTSWFFSSCGRSLSGYNGDLRDPLARPQERPVSVRVERGSSGFLSSQCRVLFHVWSRSWNLRFPLQCWNGTWGYSGVSHGESGLVSCGCKRVHFPPVL